MFLQDSDSKSSSASCPSLSLMVHKLTPSLWHALDVWRCAVYATGGLESALNALAECGGQFTHNNW
jgi:hypothetical protein